MLVALAIPLPLAWRRVHPVGTALAISLAWLIPTDGYLFLGYLVAFLAFYSLAAHVGPARTVLAVAAVGVAAGVASNAIRGDVAGEYFGALPAVVLATITGRVVRRLREQAERLAELTVHLEHERGRAEQAAVAGARPRPRACAHPAAHDPRLGQGGDGGDAPAAGRPARGRRRRRAAATARPRPGTRAGRARARGGFGAASPTSTTIIRAAHVGRARLWHKVLQTPPVSRALGGAACRTARPRCR